MSRKGAWRKTIDLSGFFHDDSLTSNERANRIVTIFLAQCASDIAREEKEHGFSELEERIDEFTGVATAAEFNAVWSGIYDWCDDNRVWVRTL